VFCGFAFLPPTKKIFEETNANRNLKSRVRFLPLVCVTQLKVRRRERYGQRYGAMEIIKPIVKKTKRTLIEIGEALGIHNLDPEPGLILITGGSGVIGHRVASRLLNAGYHDVRVGAHNVESVKDLQELGAEVADFAWDREDTYRKALVGVKSVLCTIPYTKNWYMHFPEFLEACNMAGVKHFIKISFYHATAFEEDRFQQVPLIRWHGDCDDQLIKFINPQIPVTAPIMGGDADIVGIGTDMLRPNMSYTILYASHLMSNPFYFQGHELRRQDTKPSKYFGASGNHGVNYVSPNDCAEVAVQVLLGPREHYNKEYTLTGPGPIKDEQVADLLSKYLKKPVLYVDQPIHEFGSEIKVSGNPNWTVADLVALEKLKASGVEEQASFVSPDIEEICRHPPQSFEEYLRSTSTMTPLETGTPPSSTSAIEEIK